MRKTRNNLHLAVIVITATIGGCASDQVEMVDTHHDVAGTTAGIDYRDFEGAANQAVDSMLASGAVNNPNGGRYVLAISRIKNETLQSIDTDQLVKKIRIQLLNQGKVATTTAFGGGGAEDQLTYQARSDLRGNAEFDQSRVQQTGTLVAPDLSLSGKIIQRNLPMSGGRTQIEYSFLLTLTDIRTGLGIWEGETPIVKRTSSKSASW